MIAKLVYSTHADTKNTDDISIYQLPVLEANQASFPAFVLIK